MALAQRAIPASVEKSGKRPPTKVENTASPVIASDQRERGNHFSPDASCSLWKVIAASLEDSLLAMTVCEKMSSCQSPPRAFRARNDALGDFRRRRLDMAISDNSPAFLVTAKLLSTAMLL